MEKAAEVSADKNFFEFRKSFYQKIPGFHYNCVTNGNEQEYALYDIHTMKQEEIDEIREATEKAGFIFSKATKLLQQINNEELYMKLGYPKESFPFLSYRTLPVESVISRLDFVKTNEGLKVLEINADTPTFIMETFHVNGEICKEFGKENPNAAAEKQLQEEIDRAILETCVTEALPKDFHLVFTSHRLSIEDTNTCKYLEQVQSFPSSFYYLDELFLQDDGVYDPNGRKIDILYRQTYPVEFILEERNEEKENIGVKLLSLVTEKKIHMINPISAFTMQNKALQSFIWESVEMDLPLFSEEEQEWIRSYFLPTYMTHDIFIENKIKYVKKPIYGREGDTVTIQDQTGSTVIANEKQNYTNFSYVYQQYIDLPKHVVQTETGPKEQHLLIGSFVINGKPSAIGIRAGNQITGDESYFLPIGISK